MCVQSLVKTGGRSVTGDEKQRWFLFVFRHAFEVGVAPSRTERSSR